MNDRGIQVLEQYDLDVKRVIKGRGAMLAECSEGYYRLLEYTGSAARLIYESELLSYIIGHGFPLVSNILRNKENALFSADSAGIRYILVQHYQGTECDVRNREDINRAARTMAALHKVLDSVKIKDAQYIPELPDQLDEMRRHNTELKRIRSYMREKTRKTEFEYAVLARFEEFYVLGQLAEQKLAQSGYRELNEQAKERGCVCHGNFNYHNLIRQEDEMAVINFEHSGKGMFVRDLYFFMRKVMEKHDWSRRYGAELLENYDKVRSLSAEEKEILRICLGYPEKFWKVLNHYYNGNKAYLPDQMKDKMRKVCQQQANKKKFVECTDLF